MGRSATSIDSRWESPMQDMHREATHPESSARNPRNARNGVSTCPRNLFLAIATLSGKIANLSGKKPNLLFTGASFFSCGKGGISRQQVCNLHVQTCSCKKQACNFHGQDCPAKKQACIFPEQVCPAKKEASNFPGQACPAKKQASNFQEQAGIFAARFPKRDKFEIANKKLHGAREKSQVHGAQKPVCRAQACPAKHPDGYRETLFRRP